MNEKTIVTIQNKAEMVGFIKSNGTECRFVGLLTSTEPKLRPGCPYKGVTKISRKSGMVNVNFNASVRRRLAERLGVKESNVEYENGSVWYEHLMTVDGKMLPLVRNKSTPNNGKVYLQFFTTKATSQYVMPNGDIVTPEQIKPWLYLKEGSSFKPTVIAVELANIKELRASGVIMQAEDFEQTEKDFLAACQ